MWTHALRITICFLLLRSLGLEPPGWLGISHAQSTSEVAPSLEDAQAVWTGFWSAVIVGDLKDARRYVHSQRQHLFPGSHKMEELQQMATQMAHCRLDPNPFSADPNEFIYRVRCEHRGETAESQVGLRRDHNGTWRLSVL